MRNMDSLNRKMSKGIVIGLLSVIIVTTFSIYGHAQNLNQVWSVKSESKFWNLASEFTNGNSGTIFLAGNFDGQTKVDNQDLSGKQDMFLARLDSSGHIIFLKIFNASDYCHITAMKYNQKGLLYIAGYFSHDLTLGNFLLSSKNDIDGFIAAVDTAFSVKWVKQIGGHLSGQKIYVLPNDTNHVLIGMTYKDSITLFDSTYSSKDGSYDVILFELNNRGQKQKVIKTHGAGDEFLSDIEVNKEGKIIICGWFLGALNLGGQSMVSHGQSDGFLIALNSDWSMVKMKQFGGRYEDKVKSIAIDTNNLIIGGGEFSDNFTLDSKTIEISYASKDIFVFKLNCDFSLKWIDTFGSFSNDYCGSVRTNTNNDIYITGSYRGTLRKCTNAVESDNFSNNEFIAKYSANGNIKYLQKIGEKKLSYNQDFYCDKDGYLYSLGNFTDHISKGQNSTSGAYTDNLHLTKYYDCDMTRKKLLMNDTSLCQGKLKLKIDSTFKRYLWSDGSKGYKKNITNSGLYTLTAEDKRGCRIKDSIRVTMLPIPSFEINGPDSVLKGTTIILLAIDGMRKYLWSDGSNLPNLQIQTFDKAIGKYLYHVDVLDSNHCKGTSSVNFIVFEKKMAVDSSQKMGTEFTLSVDVYPNPADEKTHIKLRGLNREHEVKIEVFSELGKRIKSIRVSPYDTVFALDLTTGDFEPGEYLLKISTSGKIITKKLIII